MTSSSNDLERKTLCKYNPICSRRLDWEVRGIGLLQQRKLDIGYWLGVYRDGERDTLFIFPKHLALTPALLLSKGELTDNLQGMHMKIMGGVCIFRK